MDTYSINGKWDEENDTPESEDVGSGWDDTHGEDTSSGDNDAEEED